MLPFSHEDVSPRLCGVWVPQGGVLSPILFGIHLRRVNQILPAEVRAAMYADDLLPYSRHSDPHHALLHLERAMVSLTPWLRGLGLSISIPKCQMCLFTRARRDFSGVVLGVDGVRLRCSDSLKYLGVILDARVTWVQRLKYVAGRAPHAVGLLRVLSRVSWGMTPSLLLLVYRGLVRSYLEWGAPLFMAASRSNLGMLDRAQYEALRVVLGCMRSTPVAILLSETNKPPIGFRRSLLAGRFILRRAAWRDSPLIPRLRLLSERARLRGCKLNPERCGLLAAYEGVRGVREFCFRFTRLDTSTARGTRLLAPFF